MIVDIAKILWYDWANINFWHLGRIFRYLQYRIL